MIIMIPWWDDDSSSTALMHSPDASQPVEQALWVTPSATKLSHHGQAGAAAAAAAVQYGTVRYGGATFFCLGF
jgi:hypothetical protein